MVGVSGSPKCLDTFGTATEFYKCLVSCMVWGPKCLRSEHRCKNVFFNVFLLKLKKKHVFYVFFILFYVFSVFFNVVFLLLLKQKRTITNMMHFSWTKTAFPGQSECFVAVLLTLFALY